MLAGILVIGGGAALLVGDACTAFRHRHLRVGKLIEIAGVKGEKRRQRETKRRV